LRAVEIARAEMEPIIEENNLRILAILACMDRPMRRAKLAELSGYDYENGAFEYRLKKLTENGILRRKRNNRDTFYELTTVGKHQVRGIIGLLQFVLRKRLSDPRYTAHKERIMSICLVIDSVYDKLAREGYVTKSTSNGFTPVSDFSHLRAKLGR
jgi:repressor of nif and glnA expression